MTALAPERERLARMQDTVIDKLIPALLLAAGEPAASLERVCRLTDRMHADYALIRSYATTHPGIACGA